MDAFLVLAVRSVVVIVAILQYSVFQLFKFCERIVCLQNGKILEIKEISVQWHLVISDERQEKYLCGGTWIFLISQE